MSGIWKALVSGVLGKGTGKGAPPNWPLADPRPLLLFGGVALVVALFIPPSSFKLTRQSFASLRADGVPPEVVSRLERQFEDEEFPSGEVFLARLGEGDKALTRAEVESYGPKLLFWAGRAPWRFAAVLLGLILVGGAVSLRLSFAPWQDLEDRAVSAGVVALAGLACLVGAYALDPSWDSVQMALGVGVGLCLAGALLILMPPLARRLAITALVLVHFGGIFTSVTSVSPPQGSAPYLITAGWTYFYRYYLQFMYLNNAYHFYSPDPGPPSMLWFAVKYEKGPPRWVTMPDRDQFRTRQDYQRYLALCEYANMNVPATPPSPIFQKMWESRSRAGARLGFGGADNSPAPAAMFRMPTPYSKHLVSSYSRFVAGHFPSKAPDDKVVSVKVYRVVHNILQPGELVGGKNPQSPDMYVPFYMGEFDADGNLKSRLQQYTPQGDPMPGAPEGDPFLYWAMPSEARYKITGRSLDALRDRGVPDRVLGLLSENLGGKELSANEFLTKVTQTLGPEQASRYLAVVMAFSPSDTYSVEEFAEAHAGFTKKKSEAEYGPLNSRFPEAMR